MLILDTHGINSVKDQFFFGGYAETASKHDCYWIIFDGWNPANQSWYMYLWLYIHSFWNAPPLAGSQLDGLNETSILQVLALHLPHPGLPVDSEGLDWLCQFSGWKKLS